MLGGRIKWMKWIIMGSGVWITVRDVGKNVLKKCLLVVRV